MSFIRSNNVYQSLTEVAKKTMTEVSAHGHRYFESRNDSLYEDVKDALEHDSQRGDKFIWVIKGNGSGSVIERLDGKLKPDNIAFKDPTSKYYLIECSDINRGEIMKIDQKKAKAIARTSPRDDAAFLATRKPRRKLMHEQIDKFLGLKEGTMAASKMGQEFQPNPGDKTVIRFSVATHNKISIHMLRVKVAEGADHFNENNKLENVFFVNATDKSRNELLNKPRDILITTTQPEYAEIKDLESYKYQNAIAQIRNTNKEMEKQKERTSDVDLGM